MKHSELTVAERLAAFRREMKTEGLDAYIIPTEDPHMSEYPASCWKYRKWISGFTGSAGTVVITADKAGLWTDSRYFLQAEAQLEGSGIDLYRLMLPDTPTITDFLRKELVPGNVVGYNALTYSIKSADSLASDLKEYGIKTDGGKAIADKVWNTRPGLPSGKAFEMPLRHAGKSTPEKINEIRNMLSASGADYTVLSALDEVAWTFNLRGEDVAYNPVAVGYALIGKEKAVLFMDDEKLTADLKKRLDDDSVEILPYGALQETLKRLPGNSRFLLDVARTNAGIGEALPAGSEIIPGLSPANILKSIKNETELQGFRSAVLKDGIAMTKFFKWLEESMEKGERITELGAAAKLKSFRAEQPLFLSESFAPISSYGPHGAVVHYSPSPETDTELLPDSLYLIDSGGQYLDGTTDITRTIPLLAEPTGQMRSDFTAALRGTIGIAMARFPKGIRGCLLDAYARHALWDAGINYLHGTCHGIGHCLNVHEGPQSIRMEENPVKIETGMVMSDEPAMYRAGEYGIRTENMIVVKDDISTQFGDFLSFETITLCYIDTRLIDKTQMTQKEIKWLNDYHERVYDTLADHLSDDEKSWLRRKTLPI
ncbi:MAG: aminopeptidase P family protein [Muribaculaceae bacterium]|nr:aminopeptidase P family protein [Muribaculaceae bacterium]